MKVAQALLERYRCPEDFLKLDLTGSLSEREGFFRFGRETICYGHSASGFLSSRPDAELYDSARDVTGGASEVRLPFDPTEVIENLRRERYADIADSWARSVAKNTYYFFRPVLNISIRKRLQRIHSRRWRSIAFPKWPVDSTVEDICEKVLLLVLRAQCIESIPFIWFWPNAAAACVAMTHDVETRVGRDFCSPLMDVDEAFGIKASFQIVPEKRYDVSREFLASIRQRGFEINVQDLNHDGLLYRNFEEFRRRVRKIHKYARDYGARGFRSAVLYRKPDWYEALEFDYDMSIPNVAHLDPQRGGCCTVMPYFIGGLVELPVTTTQDYTIFHILNECSMDLWKAQIKLIMGKNGLMSFIVHPDYVAKASTGRLYKELLAYLCQLRETTSLWFALPSEVERWWRARSKMHLVKHGDRWRIEGEDSEQAVVAYATEADGRLVYRVERQLRKRHPA